jgi:3-deoxy-D-manno-octulosonic-acid transferase
METEVWPQLLHQARRHQVPMVLANARLSERSLRRGKRFAALLRPSAQQLRLVVAQTEADAQRFKQFGAREVLVGGNLKFDMQPDPAQLAVGRAWRSAVGRPVVLAASSREGEEAPLLAAWKKQTAGLAQAPLLVIVPRHPQRFDEVARHIEAAGFAHARRSGWTHTPPAQALAVDVWLGDSMGEMALYYSLAHVALLGGSFAPLGGQNLIEAAACACPVVMGPHTFNFAQAAELALEAGVAWRVVDVEAAVVQCLDVVSSSRRVKASQDALLFAQTHRGCADKTAQLVLATHTTVDRRTAAA